MGVSSRRTLILIAAALVGAVAAYALFTYVGGIEDEANDNAERVKIFKIVQDIPKGTFGDEAFAQGLIEEDVIAKEYRPATAITQPSQIDGLVAISDLPANQVVVSNQFVTQAASLSTFSSLLKNNEVAITVSVDQIRGVAGLLVPGDFVNLLVTTQSAVDGDRGRRRPAPRGHRATRSTPSPARLLFHKVQILAVGQTRKLEPGETAATNADGTPAATTTSGPDHLRGPHGRRPEDRLGGGQRVLPDARRQGLPARPARTARHQRSAPRRDGHPAHPLRPGRATGVVGVPPKRTHHRHPC